MKMLKQSVLGILLLAMCWGIPAVAQQQQPVVRVKTAPVDLEKPAREIFVPFEDLNVILGSNVQRVFMTRAEYQALVGKASRKAGQRPPQHAVLVSGDHKIEVEEGRARIRSVLQLEVLEDGLVLRWTSGELNFMSKTRWHLKLLRGILGGILA